MTVRLLIEQYFEFVSLKGGCRGSSESTYVKMPHCWKSHALAHFLDSNCLNLHERLSQCSDFMFQVILQ